MWPLTMRGITAPHPPITTTTTPGGTCPPPDTPTPWEEPPSPTLRTWGLGWTPQAMSLPVCLGTCSSNGEWCTRQLAVLLILTWMAILMPKPLLIYLSLFFSLINGKKNNKNLINGKKRKERKIKQVENFRVQMIYGLSSCFFFLN